MPGPPSSPPLSLHELPRHLSGGRATVAGVLSGTSADGIDVVLVRFGPMPPGEHGERAELCTLRQLAFDTLPFEPELGRRVRAVLDGEPTGLAGTALLSRDLGRAFGRAARDLAKREGLPLDLVGSHGQTVWHHDGEHADGAATLQLGDGDFVAEEAGCAVVSDFRQRDIAAGGEGAPLSALADHLLFGGLPRPGAVLNLGGMANLTLLEANGDGLAWDTGPAGSLLDGIARRRLGQARDEGGERALTGAVDDRLLAELGCHPFLEKEPPKSTGRDTFGEAWVDAIVDRATSLGVTRTEDLLATAAEFVAGHVATGLDRHGPEGLRQVAVCGGGLHNRRLFEALARRVAAPVVPGGEVGVDPNAREALVFAVLAARCVLGLPSTRTSATGARSGRCPGKISPPAAP